jgi:hypothetical protein
LWRLPHRQKRAEQSINTVVMEVRPRIHPFFHGVAVRPVRRKRGAKLQSTRVKRLLATVRNATEMAQMRDGDLHKCVNSNNTKGVRDNDKPLLFLPHIYTA